MKSPVMPSNLPIQIGKNGKPLVYCGLGNTFITGKSPNGLWGFYNESRKWDSNSWVGNGADTHYAAESDSEICRLNNWGDFEEQETPASMLAQWQKAANDARLASEGRFAQLSTALAAEAAHLKECRELENAITVDSTLPLAFKSWYDQGRKDERHHARIRTTFPAMPD